MNDWLVIGLIAAGFFLLRNNNSGNNGKSPNGGKGNETPAPNPNTDEKQDETNPNLEDLQNQLDDFNGGGGNFKQDDNPGGGSGHGNHDGRINPDDYLFNRFGELTPKEVQDLGIAEFSFNDWKNASDLTTLQHKY